MNTRFIGIVVFFTIFHIKFLLWKVSKLLNQHDSLDPLHVQEWKRKSYRDSKLSCTSLQGCTQLFICHIFWPMNGRVFMSLLHKELPNRHEVITTMTWRQLKYLSNISLCDPVTYWNQAQDPLIGIQAYYHWANLSPIPDWHFLPRMAFKTALNFFAVLSFDRLFGIGTCILNNGSALGSNV